MGQAFGFILFTILIIGLAIVAFQMSQQNFDFPLANVGFIGRTQEKTEQQSQEQAKTNASPTTQRSATTQTQQYATQLDTFIVSPHNGDQIAGAKVYVRFDGTVFPHNTQGKLTFETKLVGVDDYWRETEDKTRTFTLPPIKEPAEYTFLVRAKIGQHRDSTPASITITHVPK